MLYSVKFYRFDIVGIFIFWVRRFVGKRRYILLIWRKHSDMVHYLKKIMGHYPDNLYSSVVLPDIYFHSSNIHST